MCVGLGLWGRSSIPKIETGQYTYARFSEATQWEVACMMEAVVGLQKGGLGMVAHSVKFISTLPVHVTLCSAERII